MANPGIQIKFELDQAAMKRLDRALQELPRRVLKKVLRSATNAAMTPMLQVARMKCPVRHGLLRRSLGRRQKTYAAQEKVSVIIGPRKGFKDPETGANPVHYAHLVEYGTGPHVIQSRKGKLLRISEYVTRFQVDHPGAAAKPFMRPAFDEQARNAAMICERQILDGINIETAKLGAGH